MADPPPPPSDHEMALALDGALDAMRNGRPVDRAALLARHPALADILDVLLPLLSTAGASGLAAPLAQPRQIGPYVVERPLGQGGFGVVYLALDPDARRRVAVKVLHPDRLGDDDAVKRFLREKHAIARLRHPGIVQLFDHSRQGPPWFLVTEYVEGVEPRQWCRQRAAGPADVAALVAAVADAVEYAHTQGVCHRDLKPANLLIDGDGRPHVLDFGLARLDPGATQATAATLDGHLLGSLAYMPPEQASGRSHSADARSDVYSLGVILYELLTGRLPFQGAAHELPLLILEATPAAPSEHNPAVPRDLEAVCLKCLEKSPSDRYASAAALADDLRAFAEGRPVAARVRGFWGRVLRVLDRRHLETLRRGWPALLLSLGSAILIGSVVVNYWERQDLSPRGLCLAVLSTKAAQLAVMVGLTLWLWPAQEGAAGSPRWRWADRTPTERQILSLVPGYYGSYLILMLLNLTQERHIPPAPVLAMLAGLGFLNLGATIWGWFYVWGAAFLVVALLVGFAGPAYGTCILGATWFVCLVAGSVHLHWSR